MLSVSEGAENECSQNTDGWRINWCNFSGGQFYNIYQNSRIAFEPVIPLLRIYPKDKIRQVYKDPFIQLNIVYTIKKRSNLSNLREMDMLYTLESIHIC